MNRSRSHASRLGAFPPRLGVFFRSLALCLAILPSAVFSATAAAIAETPIQRVVQGKVVDKANTALKGAVVYLKDGHTLSVKSFLAADDGAFRFAQLSQNTDYELWAENEGKKSPVKSISSFDNKAEFNITLTIK